MSNLSGLHCPSLFSCEGHLLWPPLPQSIQLWRIPSLASTAPVLWRIPSVDSTAPVHRGVMISPEELSAWGQQEHWDRQTLQTQTFHSSLANPQAKVEEKGFVWHNTPSNHQHQMNSKQEEILSWFAFKMGSTNWLAFRMGRTGSHLKWEVQTDSHSKWEEQTRV